MLISSGILSILPTIHPIYHDLKLFHNFAAALGCSGDGAEIIPIEPEPDHTGVGSVWMKLSVWKPPCPKLIQ